MSDFPWTVVRRTFEAKKYPKGSEDRARLNRDGLTSEYMPSYRYALCDRGAYFMAYPTKGEAEQEAYAANVECGALDASRD
jgi:hypothetical protein